jgi:hypothetical protein
MGVILNINDERVTCPDDWDEMKTAQYCRFKSVKKVKDGAEYLVRVFSAIIGKEYELMRDLDGDEAVSVLFTTVGFVFGEEPFRDLPIPKSIKIGGIDYTIPTNVGRLTLEQNIRLRQAIQRADYLEECIGDAVAIYLSNQRTPEGNFDSDHFDELKRSVDDLPINVTFPIGFFLLNRVNNFGKRGWIVLQLTKIYSLMKTLRHIKDSQKKRARIA